MKHQDRTKRLYSVCFKHGGIGKEHYAAWLTWAEVGELENFLQSASGVQEIQIQCLYFAQTMGQLQNLIKSDLQQDNDSEEENLFAPSCEVQTGWWDELEEE